MGHVPLYEHAREDLRVLDRCGDDEHRLAGAVVGEGGREGGGVLVLGAAEVEVGQVGTGERAVRRHHEDPLAVHAPELGARVGEGAAHAAHLGEQQEEVLVGDGGD